MRIYWTTDRDGERALGSMSTKHIVNCLKYLLAGRMGRSGCNGFSNAEWVQIFKAELTRRSRHNLPR